MNPASNQPYESNPTRTEIRLRAGADGSVERRLRFDLPWEPTLLSGATVLDSATRDTLDELLANFIETTRLEDLEWDLRLTRQRSIGRQLYDALFGKRGIGDPGRWLHFIPEIDNAAVTEAIQRNFLDLVCRIPWVFLTRSAADNAPFLMLDRKEPVAVTIDAAPGRDHTEWFNDISFPLYPTVLLVIPEAQSADRPTYGKEHFQEISIALSALTGLRPNNVLHARTYNEFVRAIADHPPHLVYFYGHGLTSGFGVKFQFDSESGSVDWRSFDEISQPFASLLDTTHFPPVVWINACLGAAAHQESALRLLAPFSSCVIAMRTLSAVDDSRALARNTLPLILLQGRAPHSAFRQVLHDSPPSIKSARWATTVIAVQYRTWSSSSPEVRSDVTGIDRDSVGDFPRLLDRKRVLDELAVSLGMHDVLSKSRPEAMLWYGDAEQGLDAFEERIVELLRDRISNLGFFSRRVELQADAAPSGRDDREQHFRHSLFCGLSGIHRHSDDSAVIDNDRIKRLIKNQFNAGSLLVILHGPLFVVNTPLIKDYIYFWNDYFDSFISTSQALRIVLAFGFFDTAAPELPLKPILALGSVPPRELEEHMLFFRSLYNLPNSRERVAEIADDYVDEFRGRFSPIRRKLEERAGFRESADIKDEGSTSNARI